MSEREIDGNGLLSLLLFVRQCSHPERYTSNAHTIDATGGDRWCMACGSVRVQGNWITPSWFTPLDKLLQGVPGTPVS